MLKGLGMGDRARLSLSMRFSITGAEIESRHCLCVHPIHHRDTALQTDGEKEERRERKREREKGEVERSMKEERGEERKEKGRDKKGVRERRERKSMDGR